MNMQSGAANRPVLDVRNLTITYDTEKGPLHTVRDVSMQIAAGEIYGLVGESGSGKTTLARVSSSTCLQTATRAGATFAGRRELAGLSRPRCARSGAPRSPWCTRIRTPR